MLHNSPGQNSFKVFIKADNKVSQAQSIFAIPERDFSMFKDTEHPLSKFLSRSPFIKTVSSTKYSENHKKKKKII